MLELGEVVTIPEKPSVAKQLYNYIVAEVQKALASKRVTEDLIKELDQKIHYEAYVKEKKEAILEDRKSVGALDDAKSHVSAVRERYAGLDNEVDARSRASLAANSIIARSQATNCDKSITASALLLKERLKRDFPNPPEFSQPKEGDKLSIVSGFESEIDEWAALNKYA